MAGQQIVYAETVVAMKRALTKPDDASESDDFIAASTNRGNKLKRKAKYVQEGRLNQADGPRVYRRKLNYNGYQRYTISRNPPRIDFDGDIIENEDDEEAMELSPAEDDPYADIRLEEILMPLTSAANLHIHPSLSKPYYSRNLDEMVSNAENMVRTEQTSLWKAKRLLAKFRGDEIWIPCGRVESEQDICVFGQLHVETTLSSFVKPDVENSEIPSTNWENMSTGRPVGEREDRARSESNLTLPQISSHREDSDNPEQIKNTSNPIVSTMVQADESMIVENRKFNDPSIELNHEDGFDNQDKNQTGTREEGQINLTDDFLDQKRLKFSQDDAKTTTQKLYEGKATEEIPRTDVFDRSYPLDEALRAESSKTDPDGDPATALEGSELEDEDTERPAHRMTTRARAQAATDHEPSTSVISGSPTPSIPFVHPFFSVPPHALPDADCGLPPAEADKTRRLLMMYVQKQEEVCRGAKSLYDGLLKASRLKKTVLRWCKAEGHVGELEDGEDWYDLEEWGLDEDLKKGEEQEDDEGGIVGPNKKTRRARAAA